MTESFGKSEEATSELTPERRAKLRRDLDAFLIEPGGDGSELRVVANILDKLDIRSNQMIVAPVGSGKTLACAVEALLGKEGEKRPARVIVVQPTQQLEINTFDTLGELYGRDIVGHWHGGKGAGRRENPEAPLQVVTTGIFWIMLKTGQIGPDDYVFFDEVHKSMENHQIEAGIAVLAHLHEQGKRSVGVGMATGTFPTQEETGRKFIDFARLTLLATGEKTKWRREVLPGGEDILDSAKNYLSDPTNNGRNLLVLVPSNRKVADIQTISLNGRKQLPHPLTHRRTPTERRLELHPKHSR